jgi:nucleotide-binding universal stress UspA family protein
VESTKKTILVPVDFQDASLEALALARDIGGRLGMDIVLLHVFSIPVVVYPGFEPIMAPGLPEEIETAARRAIERLADSAGGAKTIVASGDPAAEILRVVEQTQPAFVVMGTHGRKGLSHLFMGSVAEEVIRASRSPVITVREAHKKA